MDDRAAQLWSTDGDFFEGAEREDRRKTAATTWAWVVGTGASNHAHIGSSCFLSSWDEAAILILNGRAEANTGFLAVGRDAEIGVLEEIEFPHSLGLVYGTVTQFLGFRLDSDEWNVMAFG